MKLLDVTNSNEVYTFFNEHKPDVVIWCLTGKENERLLIENGLNNVINCINKNRLIFVSTDAFAEGKGNYTREVTQSMPHKIVQLNEEVARY